MRAIRSSVQSHSGSGWVRLALGSLVGAAVLHVPTTLLGAGDTLDFNRDVRRVLSENCFSCHGPDAKEKKGGGQALRLDVQESALAVRNGHQAVAPGHPEKSELVRRIESADVDDRMPPPESGKTLKPAEIEILKKWIAQGAPYSKHWAYVPPVRPEPPKTSEPGWVRSPIDAFVLARLEKDGWKHAPESDPLALARRVALDLTGLPPTLAEIDQFVADKEPGAYERFVDRMLKKDAYGEHWARLWLDQARYADSSGYADDPARTIWAYRDYVIRSFNANKPFDQFTIEQLAGDLLPDPTDEQLIATAFHRNTLTNNEGGTNDEEYRNVAIVDRVNTTLAVWMGTTMACAQCHNHKYDPITQEEYFKLFAVLNNTADADRGDESPTIALYTPEQKLQRKQWASGIERLEKVLQTPTPELDEEQAAWEKRFTSDLAWHPVVPAAVKSKADAAIKRLADGTVQVERGGKADVYTVEVPGTKPETVTALRIEVLPDNTPPARGVGHASGNFVLSRVGASIVPPAGSKLSGRFVRVELPGKDKFLSLAEVQVFRGEENLATRGEASQSSTAFDGPAKLAIDGNTDGIYTKGTTTHTAQSNDPWWEVDLKSVQALDRVVLWNRTDGVQDRLAGARISLLNEKREPVWQQTLPQVPNPSAEFRPDGARQIVFATAFADYSEKDFSVTNLLNNPDPKTRGWAIGPRFGEPHAATLVPSMPFTFGGGSNLVVQLDQLSKVDYATIAGLRISVTDDPRASEFARVPAPILATLRTEASKRTEAQRDELRRYFLTVAPSLQREREQLARLKKKLEDSKPYTTVPVMRELAANERRKTHLQRRGNFMDLGKTVIEGLPASFNQAPEDVPLDRLALAQWLVDRSNPLTARVMVNRLWESIFGTGIVRTSEEFGAQGEPPTHPELLDWLAVEFMDKHWDIQHMLRLLVTSSAYRQSSRVTPEQAAQDPDNRLLARGPRFRQTAETIRDQALFVSGLLSPKMFGPPVKPVQPKLGLSAAFGSGTDWEPSMGEDRYRRALYTTWRRSNPYPSMATFDAPNREVCQVRRERSNTPLQALVTLNDPVYMEAAQSLARRMAQAGGAPVEKLKLGFRLCLSRPPNDDELKGLVTLFDKTLERFKADPAKARDVATKPLGDLPAGMDTAELAALTVAGNVLLNLDEMLMKR